MEEEEVACGVCFQLFSFSAFQLLFGIPVMRRMGQNA
jgi:hypothetical protein